MKSHTTGMISKLWLILKGLEKEKKMLISAEAYGHMLTFVQNGQAIKQALASKMTRHT